jgi:hypothetical protein
MTFREGVFWIDLERDVIQSLISYRQERLPWREYLRPYLNEHTFAVWNLRDLGPFLKRVTDAIVAGPVWALGKTWERASGKK